MFGKYESLDMECPNCGSIYNVSEICFVCTDLEKIIRDAIKKAETVKKTNNSNVKDDLDFAQEKLVAAIIPMVFSQPTVVRNAVDALNHVNLLIEERNKNGHHNS